MAKVWKYQRLSKHPKLTFWLNILLAFSGLLAIATLIIEYGGFSYDTLPFTRSTLMIVQLAVVIEFILDRFARLLISKDRKLYFKNNWLDFLLILLFIVAAGIIYNLSDSMLTPSMLYLGITQIYMLAVLVLRGVSANYLIAGSGLPPSWLLIGSFLMLCIIGSGLLMLPASVNPEYYSQWHYPEALFTAVSATCVTGLVVVDTGRHFTTFGQGVILCLIQLGGLGIMIFGTILAILAGKALSLRGSQAVGEMMAEEKTGYLAKLIKFVAALTFTVEACGALLLFPMFNSGRVMNAAGEPLNFVGAIWHSVFHSISAFCNAGFALWGENLRAGVDDPNWTTPLRDNWQIIGIIGPLIIIGGIGFPVLFNILEIIGCRIKRKKNISGEKPLRRLSLHSKIVLVTSLVLILVGAIGFSLVEIRLDSLDHPDLMHSPAGRALRTEEWAQLSGIERMRASIFQSITARTAGFNTMDLSRIGNAGKLWMSGLMTIGGSPASTAGGMKTVTFVLLIISAWGIIRQRTNVEAFGRTISDGIFRRAATLVLLYLMVLLVVTFLLCMAMPNEQFIDLLFESSSALGTVGLSTGVTTRLTLLSKFVITATMFIGRVGPLTLIVALGAYIKRVNYTYPREGVLIG